MTNEILNQFLGTLKNDVIHSLQANGKMATGHSMQQIKIVSSGTDVQLEMPGYMLLLESGRGPTAPDAVLGNPPMIERIKAWCSAKGIPDKAAWAIKKSIDKNGFKGIPGILSEPLGNDNISIRLNPAAESIADATIQQIADIISL